MLNYYAALSLCLICPVLVCMSLTGEMAKQMKVKKLKNLKTLDSKPGKCFILVLFLRLIFHYIIIIFYIKLHTELTCILLKVHPIVLFSQC